MEFCCTNSWDLPNAWFLYVLNRSGKKLSKCSNKTTNKFTISKPRTQLLHIYCTLLANNTGVEIDHPASNRKIRCSNAPNLEREKPGSTTE